MRDIFEVRSTDAAGRIGELTVPRAGVDVETPALMPVINPHLQTVDPGRLASEFGAQILITNAYILRESDDVREEITERGLHEFLGFDGAIMTDSGAFQLAAYGDDEIDVTTEEILEFQAAIGADIGTPVDIPTPPDVPRDRAAEELETTEERLAIADGIDVGEMLVSAPIQGSTHLDLREQAARHAYETSLDVFPIGAIVPLMNDYRFADLVDVVAAAKRGLGADAPVHLFGAGHPMMFALAAAMGCDLFDSAAYAIYARDGRYLTVRGTRHLDDLEYFPCACPVCTELTPDTLRDHPDEERETLLAEHNLHITFTELRRVKQAIRTGNLLELVEARARSHPTMLDGYRALTDHAAQLERSDPASKGTFFYLSGESARRPEVYRHHERLVRFDVPDRVLLTEDSRDDDRDRDDQVDPDDYDAIWRVVPPFGPCPPAVSETYPLTAEVPTRTDVQAREQAAAGISRLVKEHPDSAFTLTHHGWPHHVLATLPDDVTCIDLDESTDGDQTIDGSERRTERENESESEDDR